LVSQSFLPFSRLTVAIWTGCTSFVSLGYCRTRRTVLLWETTCFVSSGNPVSLWLYLGLRLAPWASVLKLHLLKLKKTGDNVVMT
jgi:hypothetical protein